MAAPYVTPYSQALPHTPQLGHLLGLAAREQYGGPSLRAPSQRLAAAMAALARAWGDPNPRIVRVISASRHTLGRARHER